MSKAHHIERVDAGGNAGDRPYSGAGGEVWRVPDRPPGWTENPSSWRKRLPPLLLAIFGAGLATYLSLDQWGVINSVWDPFFGTPSALAVLHSLIDKLSPIPDATLGAASYYLEILLDVLGSEQRWRRQPWIPLFVGSVFVGMAAISTLLIISQGVLVHQWCTLCLASAFTSLVILALGVDEAVASLQYLQRTWARLRSAKAVWLALWGRL